MTAPASSSASGESWTVTASPLSVRIVPGQSATVSFTVTNNAATPAHRPGTLAVLSGTGTDASWFTIDRATRTFDVGGTETFAVTVRPPTATATGERQFSCIAFDADHPAVSTTTQSSPVTLALAPPQAWTITATTQLVRLDADLTSTQLAFQVTGPAGRTAEVRIRQNDGEIGEAAWLRLDRSRRPLGPSGSELFRVTIGPPDPKGFALPVGSFLGDLFDATGIPLELRASSDEIQVVGPSS
ncbi:hypothetical protein OG581_52335 [Streptomyces sp. NBC_01386]|uniref:hypothetical protein n=1 Tax=Streptomyces sp. NBC_01386 TaxID=2903848 RepID=UPI0032517216